MTEIAPWLRAWMAAGARRAIKDERGASLVEYALLVALIAVVCIGAVTLLGGNTNSSLGTAASSI